jgi:hypothetical protein
VSPTLPEGKFFAIRAAWQGMDDGRHAVLLPAALSAAFAANRALTVDDLISQAEALSATPPFGGGD